MGSMPWSDDIRCLYCDGKLPLYRKITNGQFCCSAHRKAYWEGQERLAVERLHQTHDALRAYRPPVPLEDILGPLPPTPAETNYYEICGFVSEILVPCPPPLAQMRTLDPAACGMEPRLVRPRRVHRPGAVERRIYLGGYVGVACWPMQLPATVASGVLEEAPWRLGLRTCRLGGSAPRERTVPAAWLVELRPGVIVCSSRPWIAPPDPLLTPALAPLLVGVPQTAHGFQLPPALAVAISRPGGFVGASPIRTETPDRLPARPSSAQLSDVPRWPAVRELVAAHRFEVPSALSVAISRPAGFVCANQIRIENRDPLPTAVPEPVLLALPAPYPEEAYTKQQQVIEDQVPQPCGLLPLGRRNSLPAAGAAPTAYPIDLTVSPALPLLNAGPGPEKLANAGLQGLRLKVQAAPASAAAPRILTEGPRALDIAAADGDKSVLSTPAARPRLHLQMAEGRRYPVGALEGSLRPSHIEPEGCAILPADVAMPPGCDAAAQSFAPSPCRRLQSLKIKIKAAIEPCLPRIPGVVFVPQPLLSKMIRPASKLEPMDTKPVADSFPWAESTPDAGVAGVPAPAQTQAPKPHPWTPMHGFWQNAPRDLKVLVFALPVLLALALHPALPKVQVAAPKLTGQFSHSIKTAVGGELATMRQAVLDRAAVALDEDFRSGLDEWVSRGDATTAWSFDSTGFVRPGPLALYRPTMALTDYQVQFLGLIDKKALSWVVRASDFDNYYVVKLVILKPGPLTQVGITRYAVIQGRAQNRVDTVVPIVAREDMLYRVQMDVHEDDFALLIQGQMADNWSEPRLPRGGLGFFSARGEESRVRWLQVTHQYDMIGRLCAYLAPMEIPNGSW